MISVKEIEQFVKRNKVYTPKKTMKCPNCHHYHEVAQAVKTAFCRKCLSEMKEVKIYERGGGEVKL